MTPEENGLLARIDERTIAIQKDIADLKSSTQEDIKELKTSVDDLYEGRNDNKSRLDKLETEHRDIQAAGGCGSIPPSESTPWYKSQRTRDTATGGGIVGIILLIVQFLIDYFTKAPK